MTLYMLDTNTVSYLVKNNPTVAQHVRAVTTSSLCISAITHGELLFGLAKRPEAIRLGNAVREFLRRVQVLPWDKPVAEHYGAMRAWMAAQGKVLAPLDLLIASHALTKDAVLVTNDQSFCLVPKLQVENWTS